MVFEFFLQLKEIYKYNLFLLIILISKITVINSKKHLNNLVRKLISFGNEITIRINGKGEHNFIFRAVINTIESIKVNNKAIKIPTSNKIRLEEDDNTIKIKFYLNSLYSLNQFFKNCENITEIDLSNFNSTLINGMDYIFSNCISLTSINLNNFDTSNIKNMQGIFQNCRKLKSLNLSNFNTSLVHNMYGMFSGCNNLLSLNLSNFNTSLVQNMQEMFSGCNNLISLNLSNFNFSKVIYTVKLFNGCNNINILDLTNITISNQTPINSNFTKLKYIIFKNSCIPNKDKCNFFFKNIPNNIIICSDKINEIIRKNELHNKCITNYCGDDWENIKKNISKGNGDCSFECEENLIEYNGRCFKNITNENISDIIYDSNIMKETNIQISEMNIEIRKSNSIEIIKSIPDSMKNIYTHLDMSSKINNSVLLDDINITKIILNGDITSLLANINDENFFKIEDNKKYQISTLSNQYRQNSSIIDLGYCEELLKSKYNIIGKEELIIFKIENNFEGFNIPIIEYEIYLRNGTKISLDICKDKTVSYFIPVSINESEIFKYDPESNFYNNRCDKYTTENYTDITLYDRKNEYNNKNLSLCEFNCTFKGYNNSKVECDCLINTGLNRLNMNQTELLNKLKSTKSIINMDVMQCTEILISKEDLESNPGFYLLIFILVVFIIIFIIFWIKGYNNLKDEIENVIYKIFKEKNNISKMNNIIDIKSNKNNNIKNNKKNKITKKKSKNSRKNKKLKNTDSIKELRSSKINNNESKKQINKEGGILTATKDIEMKKKLHETDYELNSALYEDAKKFDKRSGCEYYYSLLQRKQIFIFTFLTFNDYNSGIIKKYIFFLMFALHYSINALFFNDTNMHQILQDQGNYNITYQLKYIIISTILSTFILRIILYTLVLTDRNIHDIKCQPNLSNANILKKKTLKYMKIKFLIFFLLNLILLVIFWYYLTCWNAVYQNTQIYLIKNTLISFGISLIYPFIINIIPVILRKLSLKKGKRECLYKTSKIMQIL